MGRVKLQRKVRCLICEPADSENRVAYIVPRTFNGGNRTETKRVRTVGRDWKHSYRGNKPICLSSRFSSSWDSSNVARATHISLSAPALQAPPGACKTLRQLDRRLVPSLQFGFHGNAGTTKFCNRNANPVQSGISLPNERFKKQFNFNTN